jgi:hypothetical protein
MEEEYEGARIVFEIEDVSCEEKSPRVQSVCGGDAHEGCLICRSRPRER